MLNTRFNMTYRLSSPFVIPPRSDSINLWPGSRQVLHASRRRRPGGVPKSESSSAVDRLQVKRSAPGFPQLWLDELLTYLHTAC